MSWNLTILGSSSALPTKDRMLSGQFLETDKSSILFDCSEGIQFRLKSLNIKFFNLDIVLITHLHGDHYFGIFGLLNTLAMLNRKKDLTIVAPQGLKEIIDIVFSTAKKDFKYQINFIEVKNQTPKLAFENSEIIIKSVPLSHSIPTYGYIVEQRDFQRNIIPDKIEEFGIDFNWIKRIKRGEDFVNRNGEIIPNSELTFGQSKAKSFAYITDTVFLPHISNTLKYSSLLYHEATFADDLAAEAAKKQHSTGRQAGLIAKASEVEMLLIGHFSTRYQSAEHIVAQAKEEFDNVVEAVDGMKLTF